MENQNPIEPHLQDYYQRYPRTLAEAFGAGSTLDLPINRGTVACYTAAAILIAITVALLLW